MVKIAYDNSTERLFGIAQLKQSIDLTSDKLMMLKKTNDTFRNAT